LLELHLGLSDSRDATFQPQKLSGLKRPDDFVGLVIEMPRGIHKTLSRERGKFFQGTQRESYSQSLVTAVWWIVRSARDVSRPSCNRASERSIHRERHLL
jgi:hypothetical protein